ncbi:formylglycine-generating enzyme family protein [Actinoplanes derwentensis]|uniref:Formylglycine-generating enzyme, required for sulfatase activity, contains SUMF1/FGE domain n=1 Tax=Actinoplanes derwentensis TaxID=113562 RepID=A0A1H2B9J6_9ACTN|nr:SUMF1/EgtB/PvdO family nonheme iron enzyme [Actinoplanes derwentensis]GID86482.1 hypothetical protein Ade03nite_54060 [Actinoplanes derwentensis]SDT54960.1 Formylglycine-generating enzyme, required for sulfatase activity, contains SUMF1/FGE domain [Actinoplanes derwentensis]
MTFRQRLTDLGVFGLFDDPRIGPVPAVVPVPGGLARIGLPADRVDEVTARWAHAGVERDWILKESPDHEVRIDGFWIGRFPVTNCEYLRFLEVTGRPGRPSTWQSGAYPWEQADHPVAGVQAGDADAYAFWLTGHTGHPWRLPSEAEWEWAAAGPVGAEFPWGDEFDPDRANTRETGLHCTSPVGAFPGGRSWCGALDMAGNVEEFTADDYRAYPGGTVVHDDLVALFGEYRVARGGSFARHGDLARVRRRHGAYPSPDYPIGFRLATSVDPS